MNDTQTHTETEKKLAMLQDKYKCCKIPCVEIFFAPGGDGG